MFNKYLISTLFFKTEKIIPPVILNAVKDPPFFLLSLRGVTTTKQSKKEWIPSSLSRLGMTEGEKSASLQHKKIKANSQQQKIALLKINTYKFADKLKK